MEWGGFFQRTFNKQQNVNICEQINAFINWLKKISLL